MRIKTTRTLQMVETYYRECKFGVDDPMDWNGQFGSGASFIGKLTPVRGDETGLLYDFTMDKVTRGMRDSAIHVLNDSITSDRVLMEHALMHDYALEYTVAENE